MNMALKADVALACRASGTAKPIDLVHLSNQTMGDRNLEMEILKMFANQIPDFLNKLNSATNEAELKVAAHTIKGAARNIGAFKLADIAQDCESSGLFNSESVCAEMLSIQAYIAEIA